MLIHDMSRKQIIDLLRSARLGHIACAQGAQPYVTPLSFAYHGGFIYSFGTLGKRIEWMRANALVCIETEKIVSHREWQTVVIFGQYQELPKSVEFDDARQLAHDLLATTPTWWEPGYAKTLHEGMERPLVPIYFRIVIEKMSGREGVAGQAL
jgi:uncharacterized protein